MNFFRCNCANIEPEIVIPNVNIYVDQLTIQSMSDDKVINIKIDVTVFLESIQLNRKLDNIYLYDCKNNQDNYQYNFKQLKQGFLIPLDKQDDSCQEFCLNLNLSVFEGTYQLFYLRTRKQPKLFGDVLFGEWEIVGNSQQLSVEFIEQQCLQQQKITHLKDITNSHKQKVSISENQIEDENPKITYFLSKTPKLKRKKN